MKFKELLNEELNEDLKTLKAKIDPKNKEISKKYIMLR